MKRKTKIEIYNTLWLTRSNEKKIKKKRFIASMLNVTRFTR